MEHVAFQTMLHQPVIRDHIAAKTLGVVVTGMAGEGRSGPKRHKYDGGAGEFQILVHICPIPNSWLAVAPLWGRNFIDKSFRRSRS
jgi:hypothetical protein